MKSFTPVLADRTQTVTESATLALNARAKQLAVEGRTIYNLTAGELASDTPEYIQQAVAQTLHLNKYTPVAGLPELRQAIATNAQKFYNLSWIAPENVVVTAGAKPALYLALLALINPGDEVIVPTPAWVSYRHLIELAGGTVVEVPLSDNFDLDTSAIQKKLSPRTKAILVNSPHNPTGAVFSKANLEALATLLRGQSITVIADDIYAKLVYVEDFVPTSAINFEQLIIINGFSKSQALTGWRIGYLIAEKSLAAAVTNLSSHTMGNAPVPSQHAALAALAQGDQPPTKVLEQLKRQRELVTELLADVPQLKVHALGGAFYVYLDVREATADTVAWCEHLLNEQGVALVSGEAFGTPGFARLSFVTDEATLRSGLTGIANFMKQGSRT